MTALRTAYGWVQQAPEVPITRGLRILGRFIKSCDHSFRLSTEADQCCLKARYGFMIPSHVTTGRLHSQVLPPP